MRKEYDKISCNPFSVPADYFLIDLLTDSGTSRLFDWQAHIKSSFLKEHSSIQVFSYARLVPRMYLDEVMESIFGPDFNFYPTLQGRAAEMMLIQAMIGSSAIKIGDTILSNRPFDTTKGHIQNNELNIKALTPMTSPRAYMHSPTVFMGNISLARFQEYTAHDYSALLVTVTDNGGGGQPVSMKNYKELVAKAHTDGKFVWVDACRIFENALFVKAFEKEYSTHSLVEIAREMLMSADVVSLSFKKMYSHSGGAILINRKSNILTLQQIELMDKIIKRTTTVVYGNGFSSYSGLTGEGMIEIITGLMASVDEELVAQRVYQLGFVGAYLREKYNFPVISGGHALYIAADTVLSNVSRTHCPAEYLNAILMHGLCLRGCGLGLNVYGGRVDKNGITTFSHDIEMDSLRLAVPRNEYTNTELLSVLSIMGEFFSNGSFANISSGLLPIDYVDDGFYHFAGSYEFVNRDEFDEIVSRLKKCL